MITRVSSHRRAVLALASALAVTTSASAQTWDRGAGTNNWGDALNWSGDTVPASGADVTFGNTGFGTVNLGGTRNVNNVTFNVTAGSSNYLVSAGILNFSGQFLNQGTASTVQLANGTELQGTGNVRLQRSVQFGEFGSFGARTNNYSGGTMFLNGAAAQLQYNGFTGTSQQYLLGTGTIQMGAGTLNTSGGAISYNQGGSARMTLTNNFVNAITRDNNFGSNQLEIRYDGGTGEAVAATTRLTGNFTTAALGTATGHGWTTIRGRAWNASDTQAARQFSAATFELSGDWTGYAPVQSKFSLMQGAFILENANSVANITYTLNANNTGAQSTVLALGSGFGANAFNRAINIEVGANNTNGTLLTNNSNAANATNQTYIGGRQGAGVTNFYSGAITFNNANAHRLNLFSDDGRTNFSGNITASANQVVAINSNYSMSTYTSIAGSGQTQGDALTAFTPDGTVAFTGGTKNFAGGLEHTRGTLLIEQSISGNTSVAGGAIIGSELGGSINGNLSFADGAKLLFSNNTLAVSGTTTFAGTFGVADVLGLSNSTVAGTYTLIGGTVNFANIINVGSDNAYDLGNGLSAYFQQGSLQLVVTSAIPEPSTFAALAGLGVLGLAVVRRRRQVS